MQALIYVSTATAPMRARDVDAIVATARRVNPSLGLTGMLLWCEDRFVQHLEGPPDSIDMMWARLMRDPRHREVVCLDRWPLVERLFADWSMGSRRLAPRESWALVERIAAGGPGADSAIWALALMTDVRRALSREGADRAGARGGADR